MENPVHLLAFRTLGAAPTPMAWPEVIGALQQGVIDGQENPLSVFVSAKLWQVQKNLTLTGHVYAPVALIVSPAFFNGLTDAQKTAFIEGARIGAKASRDFVDDVEAKGVAEIKSHGVNVVTQVNKAPFQAALTPAYQQYAAKFGQQTLDQIAAVK
jgi:TRAP-type C4-dicarboxylate transport system substrate-binding protein